MANPKRTTDYHRASGTYRADRHSPGKGAAGNIGEPPATMDAEACITWREIVAQAPTGLLGASDRLAVETLAVLVVRMRAGKLPASAVAQVRGLLFDLGLTPRARQTIDVPPIEPEPMRGLAAFRR